jgi:hypothetical protein
LEQSKLVNKNLDDSNASYETDKKKEEGEFKLKNNGQYSTPDETSKEIWSKFALSIWDLENGDMPTQVKELKLDGLPHNGKFYLSSEGNFIYFFYAMRGKDPESPSLIRNLIIIDINGLDDETTKFVSLSESIKSNFRYIYIYISYYYY